MLVPLGPEGGACIWRNEASRIYAGIRISIALTEPYCKLHVALFPELGATAFRRDTCEHQQQTPYSWRATSVLKRSALSSCSCRRPCSFWRSRLSCDLFILTVTVVILQHTSTVKDSNSNRALPVTRLSHKQRLLLELLTRVSAASIEHHPSRAPFSPGSTLSRPLSCCQQLPSQESRPRRTAPRCPLLCAFLLMLSVLSVLVYVECSVVAHLLLRPLCFIVIRFNVNQFATEPCSVRDHHSASEATLCKAEADNDRGASACRQGGEGGKGNARGSGTDLLK